VLAGATLTIVAGVAWTVASLTHQADQAEAVRAQQHLAERAELARELHLVVERVRDLDGADGQPVAAARALDAPCRALWAKRALIAQRLGGAPERPQLHDDLLDLAI